MKSFPEVTSVNDDEIAQLWDILLSEEPDPSLECIDPQSVTNLLEMLHQEKAKPIVFSNSEVLQILKNLFQECFRIVPNFDVTSEYIVNGKLVSFSD